MAVLDENLYEKGIKITDEEVEKIKWNYIINKNT